MSESVSIQRLELVGERSCIVPIITGIPNYPNMTGAMNLAGIFICDVSRF
jgi:hypothetical protein